MKKKKKKRAPRPTLKLVLDRGTLEKLDNLERQVYRLQHACTYLHGVLSEVNDVPRLLNEVADLRNRLNLKRGDK